VGDVIRIARSGGGGGIIPANIRYRRPLDTLIAITQLPTYVGDHQWHINNGTYNYNLVPYPIHTATLNNNLPVADRYRFLKQNNVYSNIQRWTDELGGQAYSNNYAVCNLTGLGLDLTIHPANNWANSVTNAHNSNNLGFNDWRLWTPEEAFSQINMSYVGRPESGLKFFPFNLLSPVILWTNQKRQNNFNLDFYIEPYNKIHASTNGLSLRNSMRIRTHF